MELTSEHEQIRQSFKRFIEQEINPRVEAWEAVEALPAHELFRKLGKAGFLGINKPVEYGGMGLDYSYQACWIETKGYIRCGAVPMAIGVHSDMTMPSLARFGSDELCREFLVPSISGELVACLGVSETGAGSDVAAIATRARKDGGDYIIDGGKMWITNGAQADWMCLLTNTSDDPPHRNKSLMVLPMKAKGVTISRKLNKLGMRMSDTAEVLFDGVRIPQRYRIGEEGQGFVYQMKTFQEERLWVALSALVHLEEAIRLTAEYTRERKVFGRPILDNQVVHFRLAELQTEVELLRSLSWRAVEAIVRGEDVTLLASMAKLKAGRLLREVSDSCLQYWGGMGFMWENPLAQMYRDARLDSIGGGADEVMLTIIAKLMGTLPTRQRKEAMRSGGTAAAAD